MRPRTGVFATASSFNVEADDVVVVSTTGTAETSILSETAETFRTIGRVIAWPTVSEMFSSTVVANPCLVTVSL